MLFRAIVTVAFFLISGTSFADCAADDENVYQDCMDQNASINKGIANVGVEMQCQKRRRDAEAACAANTSGYSGGQDGFQNNDENGTSDGQEQSLGETVNGD